MPIFAAALRRLIEPSARTLAHLRRERSGVAGTPPSTGSTEGTTSASGSGLGATSMVAGRFVIHDGRVNVGFIDGHLETMKDRKVRDIQTTTQLRIYFDPYYRH